MDNDQAPSFPFVATPLRGAGLPPILRCRALRAFREFRRSVNPMWHYSSADLLESAHVLRGEARETWEDPDLYTVAEALAENYGRDLAFAYARRHDGSRR